jgi:diadenylate cyclase
MELFTIKFLTVTIWDVVDIVLVYFIFLYLYKFFRDSRAGQMIIGLIIIFLVSFISNILNLQTMSFLMGNLRTIWLIAFVIIFQPELRRILINVGQSRFFVKFIHKPKSRLLEEIIDASLELSRRKWGGLIVLSKENMLKTIKEQGTEMNAKVTSNLMVSIFNPESPLHDVAVLIQNNMIEAAGCIFPLSQNPDLTHMVGTRHRAALGLSEESDAVIVVISEETQKISVAYEGMFYRNLNEDTLRSFLNKLFFSDK